jgi:dTDP-4-dehydrorhamnose reductase
MELLVVGGSGYLGQEVIRQARTAGTRVVATFHSRASPVAGVDWQPLDIRHRESVTALVERTRPAVIINTAYRQADWATTAEGGMHVAAAAAAAGARLVHVSSDAVFSGQARRYDETSPPDPVTPYGAAKAASETAIKGLDPAAVIVRTSLIIGNGDSIQEQRVHSLASGATTGVLFTDDVRCPVHVADLASALLELAGSPYAGIHHVAGADAVSRHQLGVLIARRDGLDEASLSTGLRARTGPPGPLDVRLDCVMTQSRLTTRLRGAREFLAATAAHSATPPGMGEVGAAPETDAFQVRSVAEVLSDDRTAAGQPPPSDRTRSGPDVGLWTRVRA